MRDLLEGLNTAEPHLINKFGGHAMAAGLSINEQHFNDFKKAFDAAVSAQLSEESKRCIVFTDGELPNDCFTMEFAQLLKQSGPWGQQFPEPVFEHTFEVIQQRIVGEKHLKLVLKHQSGRLVDAIAFGIDVKEWPDTEAKFVKVAYQLDINEFRGKFTLQLIVRELEKVH